MQDFMVGQESAGSFSIVSILGYVDERGFGEMDNNNNKVTAKNREVLLSNVLLNTSF